MSVKLDDQIFIIDIQLDPPPTPQRGFGTPLYACASIDPSEGGAFGAGVRAYSSVEEVLLDADLPEAIVSDLTVAFSQKPRPATVLVGGLSTVEDDYTGEVSFSPALATQLARLEASNPTAYVGVVESRGIDTDALNDEEYGFPAALTYYKTLQKNLVIQFHDKEGSILDIATMQDLSAWCLYQQLPEGDVDKRYPGGISWACARMGFDLDQKSSPWTGRVQGNPPSDLSVSEWNALKAKNANAFNPLGGNPAVAYPGVAANGQPIHIKVTADWFQARVQEGFATQANKFWDGGDKWPMDTDGLLAGEGVIDGVVALGSGGSSPHFADSSPSTGEEITSDDLTKTQLRWNVVTQILNSAIKFIVSGTVSSDPVPREE